MLLGHCGREQLQCSRVLAGKCLRSGCIFYCSNLIFFCALTALASFANRSSRLLDKKDPSTPALPGYRPWSDHMKMSVSQTYVGSLRRIHRISSDNVIRRRINILWNVSEAELKSKDLASWFVQSLERQ
jgi:hypothetical protein